MSKMNLIIAGLICTSFLTFVLSGFRAEAASEETKQKQVLGGWTLVEDNTPAMMSEKDGTRINTALKESGDDLEALDLVATQVVAGMHYSILCELPAVAPDAEPKYSIVIVYQDLEGNAEVTDTFDFTLADE